MSSKTCCAAMGIQIKMSMIGGNTSSLVALRLMCYYCFSNNSRTVRLISPASGQRKIRRKFRRISMHLLLVVRDGGTYLSQSFPLFFPFSRFHSTYHMVYTVHFENRSELNDTRCGRLATNGLSLANSNPSSSAKSTCFRKKTGAFFMLFSLTQKSQKGKNQTACLLATFDERHVVYKWQEKSH